MTKGIACDGGRFARQTDHDVDHLECLVPNLLCRIRVVHIQPRKRVLDHADYMSPGRRQELDQTEQESMKYLPWNI